MRGVRFGSEGVERAGLVGVLQGQIDPVEELRGLVHGGTRIYGRQQAHLSIQMAQLDFPPLTLGLLSTLFFWSFSADGKCSSSSLPLKVPVLLTPGASAHSNVTQESLR